MRDDLTAARRDWDRLGAEDPLWAVLSRPGTRHGGWDLEAFLETGRSEAAALAAELDQLEPPGGRGLAVDLGCGVGRVTAALLTRFDEAVGVDAAPSMLEMAERLNPDPARLRYLQADGTSLPLPDGCADLVYSNLVLQHVPAPGAELLVADALRVLAPGGVLVAQAPSHPAATPRGLLRRLLPRPLRDLRRKLARRSGPVIEMHGLERSRVEQLIARSGATLLRADPDGGAGPDWVGYRYVARRLAPFARDGSRSL